MCCSRTLRHRKNRARDLTSDLWNGVHHLSSSRPTLPSSKNTTLKFSELLPSCNHEENKCLEEKTLGNEDKSTLVPQNESARKDSGNWVSAAHRHKALLQSAPACPSAVPAPGYGWPADKTVGRAQGRRLMAGKNLQHDPQQKTC